MNFCVLGIIGSCDADASIWAPYFMVALLISSLMVVAIFSGREAIRRYRYTVILRGARLFRRDDGDERAAPPILGIPPDKPQKGFWSDVKSDQIDIEPDEAELTRYTTTFVSALRKYRRSRLDFGRGWAISCLAYVVITAVGLAYVTIASFYFSGGTNIQINLFTLIVTAAFLGGYLFTTSQLIQDLWNFDISPISFLRSCRHIIVGVGLAGIASAALLSTPTEAFDNELDSRFFLLVGFVFGFIPGFGERYIFAALRRVGAFSKTYDPDAFDVSKLKPLDCIDGIDHWSAYRLELHMIRDVQNLATANPIVLYAETPFDFQQVVDWVGQAQLASVVSSLGYRKLKSIGVLSSIDLYGVSISPPPHDHLIQIGKILAEEMIAEKVPGANEIGSSITRDLVIDWIEHRLSSPHFWRLLELNLRIYEGIGFPFERPLLGTGTRPPEAN